MNRLKNIADIKAEKLRLLAKKEIIEEEIRLDFEDLKESLKPMNMIKNAFKSDHSDENENHKTVSPLTASVAGMALDLLITRLFMKNSGIVKKLITSYLIRTAGPGIVEKAGPSVVSKITELFGKFFNHKNGKSTSNDVFDQTTASDVY